MYFSFQLWERVLQVCLSVNSELSSFFSCAEGQIINPNRKSRIRLMSSEQNNISPLYYPWISKEVEILNTMY